MQGSFYVNGTAKVGNDAVNAIETSVSGAQEFLDIWLTRDDGRALASLVNQGHGFLVYMTPECPEGWHSQSDAAPTAGSKECVFRLANGQEDVFPEDFCVPRMKVAHAFREFWADGERPPSISWRYS